MSAHLIGAKVLTIGASMVLAVNATSYQNGGVLKKLGTSLTVAFVDGLSLSHSTGYPLADAETISFDGPAKFFLAAAGATAQVSLLRSYSAGATGLPTLPPVYVGGFL